MAALFLSAQAAIDQAAGDRLNRASRDSQASISLRIADNRGSTACGTSASSLAFSASIAAFSFSIILVNHKLATPRNGRANDRMVARGRAASKAALSLALAGSSAWRQAEGEESLVNLSQ
jgi:hypothetical protein